MILRITLRKLIIIISIIDSSQTIGSKDDEKSTLAFKYRADITNKDIKIERY